MGIFDFLKRRNTKKLSVIDRRDKISRVEYLLGLSHERMEEPVEAWGDLKFAELVEQQLEEGKTELAFSNLGAQVNEYFRLAILYWGQGDVEKARLYLNKVLERHEKLLAVSSRIESKHWPHHANRNAKAATYLLGKNDTVFRNDKNNVGCLPWFSEAILGYCLGHDDFDETNWQAAEDKWIKNRFPKYKLAEFDVYIKALTGQYQTSIDMLEAHEKMFKGRAKRRAADSDLLDGYFDNELIIDFTFACVLKRIGWKGRYRHSWPQTDSYDSSPETYSEPDKHLKIIPASEPEIDAKVGIITDTQKARRYIDHHLKNQLFEGEKFYSAERPKETRSKVSGALRDIGWKKDPASLDLMRAYRMSHVLNHNAQIFLCDPVELLTLKNWTKSLADEFGLHPDFIAIAGSEERTDFMDPQGSWYVYCKKDKQIYAVDRDDWHNPDVAKKDARLGLNLWPSYTSFVAWWVSEHFKSEFS